MTTTSPVSRRERTTSRCSWWRVTGTGRAVGCGGLRILGAGTAEIKRMYVEPAWRGMGVAVRILRALEQVARRSGVVDLVLETGTRQPEAMRFYEREGYRRIDNFGPYRGEPESVCYARRLPAPTAAVIGR
ncbi:GNAT family N-acetyltransferase [Saccharothrix ecbatanensis]|uniref:GNAT family N-acetyltransferase n=1 Tax=Saccharothrix ecbatanensis TaxID=1105145 RepID=UPI0028AB7D0E|nr:GNAT family N-acetyltransferase [Saccharothrix ecbatanensis]